MTATIILNAAIPAALLHTMAKKDVRYYLNGLYLEPSNGTVRAVATDGNMLVVASDAYSKWEGDQAPVIVPRDAIEWAVKNSKAGNIIVRLDGRVTCEVVASNSASMVATLVDGKFPDWKMVIPAGPLSGEEPFLACEYLERIAKVGSSLAKMGGAAKSKIGVYPRIIGNGLRSSASFRYGGLTTGLDMGGVVMSIRAEEDYSRDGMLAALVR